MKLDLNSLPKVRDFEKPSPEEVRAKFKSATSRSNWINYIVLIISIYFVWNTVIAIRHNHKLESKLDSLENKAALLEEANKNLELQKNYYSSREYQEKALKENFNLVTPGESVIIVKDLPPPAKKSTNIFSELQELRQLINN